MNNLEKCVDLTLLRPEAQIEDFINLCITARENQDIVRAICIAPNPRIIEFCKAMLRNDDVAICAVNDFPLGMGGGEAKLKQALIASRAGADEIDTVIDVGLLFACREGGIVYDQVFKELTPLAMNMGGAVKVILETGYKFYDEQLIKKATKIVENSGAFCAKTSTGVVQIIPVENKVQHVKWMHEASPNLTIKVAGGIKTMAQAQMFLDVIPNERLIFGASEAFWKS